MRLIDADRIVNFRVTADNGKKYLLLPVEKLGDIPTAYDVDKVVGEIEAFGGCAECKERGTDKIFYYGMGCKACVYGKIVDIVKRGGADDK